MADIQEQIASLRDWNAGGYYRQCGSAANTIEVLYEALVKIANDTDSKCVHVGAAREALFLAEDGGQ